jgi:hypothetical protein
VVSVSNAQQNTKAYWMEKRIYFCMYSSSFSCLAVHY